MASYTSFIIAIATIPSLFNNLSSSSSFTPLFFCNAASFNEPHTHTGKVTPFEPGDPKVSLDRKATAILSSGKPYQTQIKSGESGGRGLVVQDINAPPTIVWDRILDYDNYASMVPKTISSSNYKKEVNPRPNKKQPQTETIYTRMKVGFPMLKLEFFVKHLYFPDLNSLTWTLDYSKLSDFDDSCGYWYIIPHPEKPGWTRVFYSVEVGMYDWVPKFVTDFMSSKALTDATGWLKKYSELEASKHPISSSSKSKSAGSNTNDGAVGTTTKKKKGFFRRIFKVGSSGGSSDNDQVTEDAEAGRNEEIHVSWIRLILLGLIVLLAIYNLYLFFVIRRKIQTKTSKHLQ